MSLVRFWPSLRSLGLVEFSLPGYGLLIPTLNAGGVRILIALHHGRKAKSESFASFRGRVNISGSSRTVWVNVECNRIHCLLPFLRKLKSVCERVRLLLFLRQKFRRRKRKLKRFKKNRNCSLSCLSIHLAAVTLTADGFVDNIKFASYLTGNRPLTCKRIPKRQRPSNTRTIFMSYT